MYVPLREEYAKLKLAFAFRTKACFFRRLCLGIILLDMYTDMSSEHKNTQEFKMMGMCLGAELFLNASADFRDMKRRELITLRGVQSVTCRIVKRLGRFQATDLISSLIPYQPSYILMQG